MNRALRAATMGALLLSPVALGACSAGQVTQTETQERDKTGPMADVNNITLRQSLIPYPSGGLYEEGDDVPLQMAIVNNAPQPDTLLSIESEGFGGLEVDGEEVSGDIDLEIPVDGTVFVGSEDGPEIVLTDLDRDLTAAQAIDLTVTFEQAGPIDIRALVTTPDRVLSRGETFDFHHEEEEGEGEELGDAGLAEDAAEVGGDGGEEGEEQPGTPEPAGG